MALLGLAARMVLAGGLRQCRSQYDFWYFSLCGKHQRQVFGRFAQSPALWFLVSYSPLAQKRVKHVGPICHPAAFSHPAAATIQKRTTSQAAAGAA